MPYSRPQGGVGGGSGGGEILRYDEMRGSAGQLVLDWLGPAGTPGASFVRWPTAVGAPGSLPTVFRLLTRVRFAHSGELWGIGLDLVNLVYWTASQAGTVLGSAYDLCAADYTAGAGAYPTSPARLRVKGALHLARPRYDDTYSVTGNNGSVGAAIGLLPLQSIADALGNLQAPRSFVGASAPTIPLAFSLTGLGGSGTVPVQGHRTYWLQLVCEAPNTGAGYPNPPSMYTPVLAGYLPLAGSTQVNGETFMSSNATSFQARAGGFEAVTYTNGIENVPIIERINAGWAGSQPLVGGGTATLAAYQTTMNAVSSALWEDQQGTNVFSSMAHALIRPYYKERR